MNNKFNIILNHPKVFLRIFLLDLQKQLQQTGTDTSLSKRTFLRLICFRVYRVCISTK